MTEKNLEEIKDFAKVLFRVVKIEPQIACLTNHPFTDSTIACIKNKGELQLLDIMDSSNYQLWCDFVYDRIDESDYSNIFRMVRDPWKLTFLKYVKHLLDKKTFAESLANAWVMSENPNDDVNCPLSMLIKWFKSADKKALMTAEEYHYWESLPNEMTLYRGVSTGRNPKGLSWTDNLKKAEWFRDRWKDTGIEEGYILKSVVKKEDMLCYFNSRNEQEIVVNTKNIIAERV